ncbi:MAG: protein of unknown function DUF1622 [uncultured Gemmatimonadetes bacterium]|uniref:DUF1622 domain-containing protein n=1 Tax=uncultured Gemmatimonadota bacterium TaxID=203437 RepID=A0A6J4LH20_9BACT|nr:MAG: protein of unknown function DUF1622 [uncultured Gemmatimonadota bacterium]
MEHDGVFSGAEQAVQQGVEWLRLGVETIGALVIAAGIFAAIFQFANSLRRGHPRSFTALRLTLAHYLGVALEFQLAADILSTAVAPTWERIGKLAAIATIRTGLNYFLAKEMETEEAHLASHRDTEAQR